VRPLAFDVYGLAFSPLGEDSSGKLGKLLAGAAQNFHVYLWDAATGKEVRRLPGHSRQVTSVAFHPDGKLLASSSADGTVKVWNPGTGQLIRSISSLASSVAFSPDGKLLAGGGSTWDAAAGMAGSLTELKVWDAQTGGELFDLHPPPGGIGSVTFSPDGKLLAAASNQNVVLWDLRTSKAVLTLTGHTSGVRSVAFSPDGSRVVSAGVDRTVRLWEARTGREIVSFRGHGRVVSVAFSPDGRCVASGSDDQTVKLWQTWTAPETCSWPASSRTVTAVALTAEGKLAAVDLNNHLQVWAVPTPRALGPVSGRRLWSFADQTAVRGPSVAASPDGQQLAVGCQDNTIRLRHLATGQLLHTLTNDGPTGALAFSPRPSGCPRLLAAVAGQSLRLWDLNERREKFSFQELTGIAWDLAFSPDGTLLASACSDQRVRVWSTETGRRLLVLDVPLRVWRVAFSPDGRYLAAGGGNRTDSGMVRVWDVQTGELRHNLKGHTDGILGLAFTPGAASRTSLLSADQDGSIRSWDVETGQEMLALQSSGGVNVLAIDPAGRRFVTGGRDGSLKVWDAPFEDEDGN
jgi:WD40 repeat protein